MMIWEMMLFVLCIQLLLDGFMIYFLFAFKAMHFFKDFLLLVTYIFLLMKEPVKIWFDRLGRALGAGTSLAMGALFLIGVLQIFNPLSPGLLRGVIGLKIMYLPWAFILLGFIYGSSTERIEKIIRLVVYFSVPINIFGLIQFFSDPNFMISHFGLGFIQTTQMANIYGVHSGESFVRIIGTFPSSAHYAQFLGMNALFCYAILSFSKKDRFIILGILGLNMMALLGTGSRGGLLILIAMLSVMGLLSRRFTSMLVTALIFGAMVFGGFHVLGKNVVKRFASAKTSNISQRTIETTPKMFLEFLNKAPLGNGIGAASQAARHLGKTEGQFQLVENYLSKLQIELGIVGVFVFYTFIFSLLNRWFSIWLPSIREPNLRMMTLAMTAYTFVALTLGVLFSGIDTPPNSLYLWLFIGLMARIWTFSQPDFERY